nr:hypothetical protein HUO10_004759 [Paraburkholderia busanensis]
MPLACEAEVPLVDELDDVEAFVPDCEPDKLEELDDAEAASVVEEVDVEAAGAAGFVVPVEPLPVGQALGLVALVICIGTPPLNNAIRRDWTDRTECPSMNNGSSHCKL